MSQTFFSKLDALEKNARLTQLGTSRGKITVWEKGSKEKHLVSVLRYDSNKIQLQIDAPKNLFSRGSTILTSFDLRGMSFFFQGVFSQDSEDHYTLSIPGDFYKSERRASYRLLTFPIYEVWVEFDFAQKPLERKVVNLKSKSGTTDIFKNFLSIVDTESKEDSSQKFRIRVQDLSTTGMAIHIGDLEYPYFEKDSVYTNVKIHFIDERIDVPEVKVVHVVNYISSDKNLKKYKVGLNFVNLPTNVDEVLGGKINKLLRESDFDKDFEKFLK
jgi:hypothetical protein